MKITRLIFVIGTAIGAALMSAGFAAAENDPYTQLESAVNVRPRSVPPPSLDASKSIYGENSMQEYYQVPERLKRLADSTVAFVNKSSLYFDPVEKSYKLKNTVTISQSDYLDESEDFSSQSRLSNCSGAYLGKGMVMTAGHCVSDDPKDPSYFKNFLMVFGWKYDAAGSPSQDFQADAVHAIKKVEIRALEGPTGNMDSYRDFALVSMEGEPAGRQPLALEAERAPKIGQKVFTIGYPLGLAVKINDPDQAQIFTMEKNGFMTNIDAFGGNSGGPAFDSATDKIVGILVTAVGTEFSYELNRDFSFIADFSLPSDVIEYKPHVGTVSLGSMVRSIVLQMLRTSDASISILDENKCLITLPKGSGFQNRSLIFSMVTRVGGMNVFNRGRLMRDKQESFGTGVLLVPDEIKTLLRP
ncbi:MAG: Trypsin-like peptidase domain protein [Elusimicrobia bacterium]|nr:MAG: Trypsin-like peptidase domain protein [Elusimicrobiota bacterium]KAF0153998.1 MAG: Trypsin-like peptidase domain protein [Elusimicrobiota bacterium]